MPANFFVTGMPKCGKTTLLRRVIAGLVGRGLRVAGFVSPEERHHGTRTGFKVRGIRSGKVAVLADVNADGPKVSKYHVDIKSFESVAVPSLEDFESCDVVVVDEIGWMELKSRKFADLVDRVLDSDTPLVAALHQELVEKYGPYGEVFELTGNNHEAVYVDLMGKVQAIGKKAVKAAPEKKAAAERKAPQKKEKKAKPVPKRKVETVKKEKPEARKEKPAGKKEAQRKGLVEHLKELIGV